MSQDQTENKNWMETSASFAPVVLAGAAGVLAGDLLNREARRPVAFTLAAIGACALAPIVVGTVVDLVNGPNSRYGSRRTLRRIRDAGVRPDEFEDLDADMGEEMFVG
ncbi:hypothetical protein JIN77_11045 [Verrucomicrobiaceae bacterium R5-34]|uniref:Uncharacterized protein n=1 Tax=Oceaniferula flava TaxID=2800421 RepID=A0AAE2VCA8_9BACT|nr:hypothetical protein [Oceaniferula flavus]MBK1831266.1 hypothetical protein [Verrucomicrobiaceae bacterium R5-34]MBK1855435.1 hypothetical protein [Oceaniferula flavus]MBM1136741.1 hypothetical protein [Oceaniferula flavus]